MSEDLKSPAPQVPRPRRRSGRAAGEALLVQASAVFGRAGFTDPGFLLHWPEIAGPHIARVAQPVKWQESAAGAVVTLRCDPGAAVLLQHETRTLVETCNRYLGPGRIARFKFVAGPLGADSGIPPHPAPDRMARRENLTLAESLEQLRRARDEVMRRR